MELKKTFKSGNSQVVSIGREMSEWLEVKPGDQVMLQTSPGPKVIITKVSEVIRQVKEEELN